MPRRIQPIFLKSLSKSKSKSKSKKSFNDIEYNACVEQCKHKAKSRRSREKRRIEAFDKWEQKWLKKSCNPNHKFAHLPEYICNEKTGKWIKKRKARKRSKKRNENAPGYILNPLTKNWIKKNGKLAKKLYKQGIL